MKKAFWFLGNLVIVHASGRETEGRFALLEFLTPAGDMTPLHSHRRDSQTTYVLEGELTVYLPGETHVLRPGDSIHQPAQTPQTEKVTSAEPARVLDVNSPAGFEEFVAAVGSPAERLSLPEPSDEEPDLDELARVAAEHGIDVLGPPGELP